MKYLITVDLEGIHGVLGEEYCALSEGPDYQDAIEGAILEINTVTRALFDCGAEKVAVWDCHGSGKNIDFSLLDERIVKVCHDSRGRFGFAADHGFDAVIYLGYHAREGLAGGILAHTFSSKNIQYCKLNGVAIGELTVDAYATHDHGMASILHAGDDISCPEITELCPGIVTVITKYGKGRNKGVLRPREDVLAELYEATTRAVNGPMPRPVTPFPKDATVEIRYTRAERAEEMMTKAQCLGIPCQYGEDTHVLICRVNCAAQIPELL